MAEAPHQEVPSGKPFQLEHFRPPRHSLRWRSGSEIRVGKAWAFRLCGTWVSRQKMSQPGLSRLILPRRWEPGTAVQLRSAPPKPRLAPPRPAPPRSPHYSLDAGVARCAEALPGARVAAGPVAALARQLAALAVGARRAELLAAPPAEAGGTHAGASDGVTQGAVLALAPVAAVGTPVVAVAACKRRDGQG